MRKFLITLSIIVCSISTFIFFCFACVVCYSSVTMAGSSDIVGVSGYISSLSEKSVFITGKQGVILEVPRAEVKKLRVNIKTGEFVELKVDKKLIKASPAKSFFSQK